MPASPPDRDRQHGDRILDPDAGGIVVTKIGYFECPGYHRLDRPMFHFDAEDSFRPDLSARLLRGPVLV